MRQNKLHISSQKKGNVCSMSVQMGILSLYFFSTNNLLPSAGFDPRSKQVYSVPSLCESEEWLMLVDQTDQSHQRAVVIKNKHSGRFLAVQHGRFIGLTSYNEDCKWFLE